MASDPQDDDNDEFHQTLLQSFAAVCGISALHLLLEEMDEATQKEVKERVIKTWRNSWQLTSQMDIEQYNKVLGHFTNTEDLPQPEEIQQALNHSLQRAERVARAALNTEDDES